MKALNVRIPKKLHEGLKNLGKVEKKTLKEMTVEAIINHLGGKEILNNISAKEIYKYIILEYINKTKNILGKSDEKEESMSLDVQYLQEIQEKFFEAKIQVYEQILEALDNENVPKSITEIVDFGSDDDFVLMGKIAASKEIKYELNRILNIINI